LAERYRVPALYEFRQFTDVGGLMSYGTDVPPSLIARADEVIE
jgi:hypothetical protein